MSRSQPTSPTEWIIVDIVALFSSAINLRLLYREYKKRKDKNTTFFDEYLKWFPLISMLFGNIYTISIMVGYWPIFCHISTPIELLSFTTQASCLGFYQLSRLYFCFSRDKVYSNKGYPKWLFYVFSVLGILMLSNDWIDPWILIDITETCHFDKNWQYIGIDHEKSRENPTIAMWISIDLSLHIVWDASILILYLIKVFSFRRYKEEQIIVYRRIMSILQRITVLTLLYEIFDIFAGIAGLIRDEYNILWIHILYECCWLFSSVMMTYCVFLMQQHNTDEYNKFLSRIHILRLENVCCCNFAVEDALETKKERKEAKSDKNDQGKMDENTQKEKGYHTGSEMTDITRTQIDRSLKVSHSHVPQLSVETVLEVNMKNYH